jgi:hypothetical protein
VKCDTQLVDLIHAIAKDSSRLTFDFTS